MLMGQCTDPNAECRIQNAEWAAGNSAFCILNSAFCLMDRLDRLKQRLKELPERPGVYLHKNVEGEVIYVGKARNLRSRVQSYLVGRGPRDARISTLIHEIDGIDFVTTNNELEAILLENNLIKSHQPRYNILLRDDKTYPYIKVTLSEDFPRVVFTRRMDRKKGDQFYGPFFAGTARRLLKLVADQFKLRSCDLDIADGKSALLRPCLYYDMHQCLGPCVVGLTTREAYMEMVDDVVLFLGGKTKELQDRLTQRMYRAAEGEDVDVWGLYEEGSDVAVQLFVIRDGNLVDRRELFWEKVDDYQPPHFLG